MGVARQIVAESGVGGLYRGLSLSMMGIIPTRACYFWAGLSLSMMGIIPTLACCFWPYGASKATLSPMFGDGPVTHMAAAVAAGGMSSTVTCPIWMVKTRMQLQGNSGGVIDTARSIVKAEGVRGLYRGLGASYWGLSEGAIQFFLYEKFKVAMRTANAKIQP
ncbi:mitochondrial carrier domain-containing protein [Baffinella frigidus]|nr:mitochondrial carrier domain-containing protein [Cryptophyta sp. CCMP2293]